MDAAYLQSNQSPQQNHKRQEAISRRLTAAFFIADPFISAS